MGSCLSHGAEWQLISVHAHFVVSHLDWYFGFHLLIGHIRTPPCRRCRQSVTQHGGIGFLRCSEMFDWTSFDSLRLYKPCIAPHAGPCESIKEPATDGCREFRLDHVFKEYGT